MSTSINKRKNHTHSLPQKMPPEIAKIHNHICQTIDLERTLRPAEQIIVSQLAQHLYLQYKALQALIQDGAVLTSENRDGPVNKASPWIGVHQVSTQKILDCSKHLGISQLDYMKITGEQLDDDEEDPIKQYKEKNNKE